MSLNILHVLICMNMLMVAFINALCFELAVAFDALGCMKCFMINWIL